MNITFIFYLYFLVANVFGSFNELNTKEITKKQRPNIIFIMADDHANRAISAYDGSINQTPNIDRLADEGALFLQSFCTNSICAPSRATILTGKHSHKNGVTGNGAPWDGSQTLFPRMFKEAGYETALIGKWHLNSNPGDEFNSWKILMGAGRQGFYYNPLFISNDKGEEIIPGYSTDVVTDEALKWLNNNKGSEKPFLLFVQYKAPHVPRIPALRYLDKYMNDTIPEPETLFDDYSTRSHYATDVNFKMGNYRPVPKIGVKTKRKNIQLERMTEEQLLAYHKSIDPQNEKYYEMKKNGLLEGKNMKKYTYQRFIKDYIRCIDGVDENVGRLLNWLDQNKKLKNNTVVVYTSDQSYFTGEHGYKEKRLMYEDALKMPFLIRWPKKIKPGTRKKELIQNIDFAPTFLDMANIEIPDDIQGNSFLPMLTEEPQTEWRKSIYYHYYDHGKHKVGRHDGVRTERYKLINFYTDDLWELYDLKNDPNEVNNLYGNSESKKVLKELTTELFRLREYYEVPSQVFKAPYVPFRGLPSLRD